MKLWELRFWFWITLFCSILDIGTTYVILREFWGDELNPIITWLIKQFGLNYGLLIMGTLLKIIGLAIGSFFLWRAYKAQPKKYIKIIARIVIVLTIIMQFGFVGHNFWQIHLISQALAR